MKARRQTLLFATVFAGLSLWSGLPAEGAKDKDKDVKPSTRSAVDPSYEVLLPDPEPVAESGAKAEAEGSSDIDIADRVLSAAKSVTTVQEAPSIITVIRSEEITARGYRTLGQILETIPGWLNSSGIGNQLQMPLVRGTAQAALLLRDGVSMFEPVLNGGAFNRTIPLETLKSIEVVTGPGGVLWGANSFLGIVNLISKDPDDVNGIEVGAGYGDGDGSPQDFRAYAMFGKSFRFKRGPKLGIFQHISYETFIGPRYTGPLVATRAVAPSPPGPWVFADQATTNPARAFIVNIDGKITYGPVTIAYSAPIAQYNNSLSFGSNITSTYDVTTGMASTTPIKNYINILDRYLTIQYKSRFLKDRLGLDAKLYGIQFVRDINALIVPGTSVNPAGVNLEVPLASYRVGFSVDGDASLPLRNKLLFGGDVFHERVGETNISFTTNLGEPFNNNPGRLPINCPLEPGSTVAAPNFTPGCPLPFIFGADRTVIALYLSDQFRPVQQLTLDAGIRYQVGLGTRPYKGALIGGNGVLLGSASVVWNFYRDMHFKANFSTGFRPPVFNNTDSNGAAVQFGGNSQLRNEESRAFQGEWNARLLRNIGPIRALQLRADYAYTELNNLIVIQGGSYTNRRLDYQQAATDAPNQSVRRIHSVEAGARLYAGDHTFSLGYTFLRTTTNDRGLLRNMPQHWFTAGWVLSVIPGWLETNGTLLIIGAYDDPNRFQTVTLPNGLMVANFSDVTFDRLPPQAILNVGLRAHFFKNRLWSSFNVYNALNQKYYYPDPFYDIAPTLEVIPTPAPGMSFFFAIGGKPW